MNIQKISKVFIALYILLLTACDDKDSLKSSGQIIAKVNDQEISVHQLNFVLAHSNGVSKENLDVVKKQVLNSLVEQAMLNEQALTNKLDRDPQIMMSIEQSKRQILAQAWLEKISKDYIKPTSQEINKFYQDHPDLFAKHKIFKLKECLIGRIDNKYDLINQHISTSKQFDELLKKLDADKIAYQINMVTQPSENVPLEELPVLSQLGEGQFIKNEKENNVLVWTVLSTTEQFVDKVKATPIIETFLVNLQRKALIEKEMLSLKSRAKTEFFGIFAGEKGHEENTPAKIEAENSKGDDKNTEDVISKGLKGL